MRTAALLVLLLACGQKTEVVPGGSRPVLSAPALAEQARTFEGKRCTVPGRPEFGGESGRSDAEHCGPFPCDWEGKCRAARCSDQDRCLDGFCQDGFCVVGPARGARPCADLADGEDVRARAGCRCQPQSELSKRDQLICGSLPCGDGGCYVQKCDQDGDCAFGLCSSHASGPHGYCVTDDPI